MGLDQFMDRAAFYYEAGGFVMPWLALAALLLWYGIGYRAAVLRRGGRESVRAVLSRISDGRLRRPRGVVEEAAVRGVAAARAGGADLRRRLDDAFADYYIDIKSYRSLVGAICAVATLLGLLGTVTGMIETFDSLGSGALYSRDGGIAAGIAQALFTTQLGLAVAIPGLVIKGWLDRKQAVIEVELAQVKDILCSHGVSVPTGVKP